MTTMLSVLSSFYGVEVLDRVDDDIVRTKDGWYHAIDLNQLEGPFDTSRQALESYARYWNGETVAVNAH